MPSVVYSGTFGSVQAGGDGKSIAVSGTPIPAGATITGITYTLDISADAYSSSNEWNLLWFAIGSASGSPNAPAQFATMYSNKHTFSGSMNYSASDVNKFTGGQFTLYAKANTDHSASSYMGAFTITVNYVTYSKCTAPSGLKLSSAASYGSNATLSWTAGKGGNDNAFKDHEIQRAESSNGSTWGSWAALTTTTGNSLSVAPPASYNHYYKYRIRTRGAAGSSWYSNWVESGTLKRNPPDKCTEPSGLKLSSTTSTGSNVTLSWTAGKGGNDNAISYYQVARKLSTNGSTWGSLETVGTTTGLSLSVAPPAAFGSQYLYYVRTVGAAGANYASSWAACGSTLQKVRPSLTAYTDATITAGETPVKAVHMEELQSNINALRQGLGLAAYSFTAIRAGYTSLAGWNAHIRELRTAIDGITTNHEAWLTLGENRPRADVLMQLRRVVAAI